MRRHIKRSRIWSHFKGSLFDFFLGGLGMHSANLSLEFTGNELASQSDLRLVKAARAGSEAGFAELQQLYENRLYRTIFAITKNHEDSEDALQNQRGVTSGLPTIRK